MSEELVGETFVELEDSEDSAKLDGSAVCDELDSDSTDVLESFSEDADEKFPSPTSADESGFAKDCAGNCGFESEQLAPKKRCNSQTSQTPKFTNIHKISPLFSNL